MKTIKILTAISLALILTGIATAFSGNNSNNSSAGTTVPYVRLLVNVHISIPAKLCSPYWVEVVDESGNLVARTQVLTAGVITYTFYSDRTGSGLRIARIVEGPALGHLKCIASLSAKPDVKSGTFKMGQSYIFNLYPDSQAAIQ